MKKIAFLLAALLPLFVACEEKQPATVKVMSYNIRYGTADDGEHIWPNRREAAAAMVMDQHPLVFGVQEALDFQLEYLQENCPGYKYVGVGREDGVSDGEHMAVFYDSERAELVNWGTYWLSETPDEPSYGWDAACRRTATWALLKDKKSGKKFYFVNTHLDHKGKLARKNGLALIYSKIQAMNPKGLPMVLTGDFNVLPDDEALVDISKLMNSARFNAEDADTIGSFNGFARNEFSDADASMDKEEVLNTLWPIDYIYYSGFDKCLTFKVVTKTYDNKPYISDHYPIYADLVF